MRNFLQAMRTRRRQDLNANIEDGHLSAALCHLANIGYRLGRQLHFVPEKEDFTADAEASKLLSRSYRSPFVVPEYV